MVHDLTDTLCTRCGLCCDGTLFAEVELAGRAEATRLVVLGLEVEDGDAHGELLVQPCTALHGTRCSVYAHRPKCCRTFESTLLQDARRGAVSEASASARIAEALRLVQRARAQMLRLGQHDSRLPRLPLLPLLPLKERAVEALSREVGANRAATAKQAELAETMAALTALIRKTFLREPRASRATSQG